MGQLQREQQKLEEEEAIQKSALLVEYETSQAKIRRDEAEKLALVQLKEEEDAAMFEFHKASKQLDINLLKKLMGSFESEDGNKMREEELKKMLKKKQEP